MRAPAAVLVFGLGTVVACEGSRTPESKQYELTGQILAVRPETREVVVKHGDIPGFMPAMTMTYQVKDPALLQPRAPGDLITATLVVGPAGTAWLSAITHTGSAPLPDGAPARIPAAAGVAPLRPGDAAPMTPLTDQDGAPVSLAHWQGSAVAVTFVYLRCPLPQFCPLMDRRFAELQTIVAARPGLRGRVRLLSVSFDPKADDPPHLRAHAAKLRADPAVWRFATAPEEVVDRFAAAFGVNVIREADRTITHNLRTAVIDAVGRVVSIHDGNTWTADELAGELERALAHKD
jgi:protein SCO1/2